MAFYQRDQGVESWQQGRLEEHDCANNDGGGDDNIAGEAADSANGNVDGSRLFADASTTGMSWAGSMSGMCSIERNDQVDQDYRDGRGDQHCEQE